MMVVVSVDSEMKVRSAGLVAVQRLGTQSFQFSVFSFQFSVFSFLAYG